MQLILLSIIICQVGYQIGLEEFIELIECHILNLFKFYFFVKSKFIFT